MAKKSMIAREVKRAKLVAKYAHKRAELKEQIRTAEDPAERFELQRQLQRLPLNSSPYRQRNRCWVTGNLEVITVILVYLVMYCVNGRIKVYYPVWLSLVGRLSQL